MTERTGGCMCGAVRFRTDGEPARVIHCHCEDCRRHTGAPMATLPVFPARQVTFSGSDRAIYRSSATVGRAFCPKCGSSLTFETELQEYGVLCAIHISAFDDPESLPPTHHSFYAERLCWFDIADDLPRHARLVSEGQLMQHGPTPPKPTPTPTSTPTG